MAEGGEVRPILTCLSNGAPGTRSQAKAPLDLKAPGDSLDTWWAFAAKQGSRPHKRAPKVT